MFASSYQPKGQVQHSLNLNEINESHDESLKFISWHTGFSVQHFIDYGNIMPGDTCAFRYVPDSCEHLFVLEHYV